MVRTKIIAEVGINYSFGENVDQFLSNAKKLIDVAVVAGCDYVKFQKRSPEHCVPEQQKYVSKYVPWEDDEIPYIEYRHAVEFNKQQWIELFKYADEKEIGIFASVWDKQSVEFMTDLYDMFKYHVRVMKVPSALIHDIDLCSYVRDKSELMIISTGMSTEEEVNKCITSCNPDVVMHTNSSYPSNVYELNLGYIKWLQDKYPRTGREFGYSGHEFGLSTTMAAVPLGATWIERHITLDRTYWGSDQLASVEPHGLIKLVKRIRDIEQASIGYGPREVMGSEFNKLKSLRG